MMQSTQHENWCQRCEIIASTSFFFFVLRQTSVSFYQMIEKRMPQMTTKLARLCIHEKNKTFLALTFFVRKSV